MRKRALFKSAKQPYSYVQKSLNQMCKRAPFTSNPKPEQARAGTDAAQRPAYPVRPPP